MSRYLLILIFLLSCTNAVKTNLGSLETSEINVETRPGQKIVLSEIASDVSYVKLMTTAQNTIGSINKMIIQDNKYYIFDSKTQKILVFGINGNFLFQIDRSGRGPGEYLHIQDFLVDSARSNIEIWDNGNQKILTFDKTGKFESERSFIYYINSFCKFNGNVYICFASNALNPKLYNEGSFNVIVVDSANKLKASFLPINDLKYLSIGEQNFFERYGNGVNVSIPFDNNIYYVTTGSSIVKYKINFSNYKMPENFIKEYNNADLSKSSERSNAMIQLLNKFNDGSYILSVFNIFENRNSIVFQYRITREGTFTVFYIKQTQKSNSGIPENNIDSGLFGTPLSMNGDTLLTWFFPYELKARIKNIDSTGSAQNLKYARLKQLAESAGDNDNPIIARFLLKDKF